MQNADITELLVIYARLSREHQDQVVWLAATLLDCQEGECFHPN